MCDIITINDAVETIAKGTCIQHGKHNDRIYLMKLDERDIPYIFDKIKQLANTENYSKIVCKIPKSTAPTFFANGFIVEAFIPQFYNKREDAFFVSKFLNSDRLLNIETNKLASFSQILKKDNRKNKEDYPDFTFRELNKSDVSNITDIYKEVFETYPFPIHDKEYIIQTMNEGVRYFGAEKKNQLAAIAASEIDVKGKNAEMTDFATYPEFAGHSLATSLLKRMEFEMRKDGIHTLYTIARLNSIPMNLTFIRMDYKYSGTLIKNTNIAGNIETMNIYYKHI